MGSSQLGTWEYVPSAKPLQLGGNCQLVTYNHVLRNGDSSLTRQFPNTVFGVRELSSNLSGNCLQKLCRGTVFSGNYLVPCL